MSAKDPFQILADELTLLRHDMDKLQRTSLSKNEAEALNAHVAQALAQMKAVAAETSTLAAGAPQAVRNAIWTDLRQLDQTTSQAASKAAGQAVKDVREDLKDERANLLRPLREPTGRHGASRGASGPGWPPRSPQGRSWGLWRPSG